MELQPDSWVTETQSTLKGVTTASLKGQHSRIRRAKARENWYNTGVSNDGHLIKPFKFVDQQELRCQKNSKLLSSIRSHVKQDTYVKRQASTAAHQKKKKSPHHLVVLPKVDPSKFSSTQIAEAHMAFPNEEIVSENIRMADFWQRHRYPPYSGSKAVPLSGIWRNDPLNTFGGYGPFNRPRAFFLLSHCKVPWQLRAIPF